MSQKEEEFPFEEFVEALQNNKDIRKSIKHILEAISQKNIYWTYSALSTIVEILKSKDEEPLVKCRSLETIKILLQTCEYPVLIFIELYLVPILLQLANYKGKKSDELVSHYFQQIQKCQDSEQVQELSLEFIERGIELIFFAAKIKPYRTVETEELKQQSIFFKAVITVKQKGVQQPKAFKWCSQGKQKQLRKRFLDKLKTFNSESDEWTQFLLVNLIEEVQTGKKELLQLRLLLPYGESFLTSAVINFCEEELLDLSENLDLKKKYLGILNELVRSGDIEAIIMAKNSQFIPTIVAHISKLPGEQGTNAGENIFPEVKATKQAKRQFYIDFMRCLQTWALSMPPDYDSEDFNIKNIYEHLKKVKKFKFPQNMLLSRYQKEINQNLAKNKQRNDKLLEILENMEESKHHSLSKTPLSKMSNVLQKTTMLDPHQLELKLEEIKKNLKQLVTDQQTADTVFKSLVLFKDNWITYLQSIDFEGADENHLQNLVNTGQKCVEQIQLIVPLHANLLKGKLSFKQFKERVCETLEFHLDVSHYSITKKSGMLEKQKSIKTSKLAISKMGKSKMASKMGKSLLSKIKAKSKFGDITRMNMSKAMDRSNMMEKSKYLDKSRSHADISNHLADTSVKRHVDRKQDSKTLQIQKIQHKKEESQPEDDQHEESITKNYQLPEKVQEKSVEKIKCDTPKINRLSRSSNKQQELEDKQTSKKQSKLQSKKSENQEIQKIIRIADYEVETEANKKPTTTPRLSTSREKAQGSGSKLLLRRNPGSRLDKSGDSRQSLERRSVSGRKVKESSLFKKSQIQHSKTRKISQQGSQLRLQKPRQVETVEINVKPANEISPLKSQKISKEDQFGKFNEEEGSISSIHSNSNVKVPHHSEQKILNITAQISDINYSKEVFKVRQCKQEYVEYITKDFEAPPLVGDYYESPNKNKKLIEEPFKKKTVKEQEEKPLQKPGESPKFKNLFSKKVEPGPSGSKQDKKVKRESSENHYLKFRQEPEREERHTTKNIASSKELGLMKTKKQIEPSKSISSKHIEFNSMEDEKTKEIQALQKKIMELEKQSMSMKMKLAAKDNEIRSIKSSSKNGSERGFAHFTVTSNSNFQKSSLRSSSASRRCELTPFERQVESGFKQYLQRIKGNTFRKSLLKMKCLVHRTDELQIGCLSQRCEDILESTLYITPHRFDMVDFSISVIHDHRLKIKVAPESVKLIPALKQQKIHLMIEVGGIPFCLPEFQINYKSVSEYNSSYNRLTLPLAFNKFCIIKPFRSDAKTEKHLDYVKTDNFKVNLKVIRLQKLTDSFPNFVCLPPTKGRQQSILGATCQFGDSSFNLMLNLHQKWSWIQGFLIKGDPKAMKFLICTFKQIIEGSKK